MQNAGTCADDAHNSSMRICKTCRKYRRCLEGSREYPCRDWERRKYDAKQRNTGNPLDPHRRPQAGIPSAQDQLAGDVQKGDAERVPLGAAGIRTGATGCDRGGDNLHTAGRTDLKGGEDDDAGRQDTADA